MEEIATTSHVHFTVPLKWETDNGTTESYSNVTQISKALSGTEGITPPVAEDINLDVEPSKIRHRVYPASSASWSYSTVTNPEVQPFPMSTSLLMDFPIPSWVLQLPGGPHTLVFELAIPVEEVSEGALSDPTDWVLEFDTRTLFASVLPVVSTYFAGGGIRPHRWTLLLAGALAPLAVRPKKLRLTVGLRRKYTVDVGADLDVDLTYRSYASEIVPPASPGTLRPESPASGDSADFDFCD